MRRVLLVVVVVLGLVALLLGSTLFVQMLERRGGSAGRERGAPPASAPEGGRSPLAVTTGPRGAARGFDDGSEASLPDGFVSAQTGPGPKGAWRILEDATAPSPPGVLAQTSTDTTRDRFSMAIDTGDEYEDLELSVRFKAVSGRVDQAGGVVFRFQGPDNYYVLRANALEDNVRLYHVVGGVRTQIAGVDLAVFAGSWHTIKVVCVGSRIEGWFDGEHVIDREDGTFRRAGSVGVWTKADSLTYFDDFTVTEAASQ
jgi:hypothetical protein